MHDFFLSRFVEKSQLETIQTNHWENLCRYDSENKTLQIHRNASEESRFLESSRETKTGSRNREFEKSKVASMTLNC